MTPQSSSRGNIRWLLVGWMFAISAIAYLDRVNISVAGSALQKEFGLDNIRLGWVFSSFVFGYALFQAPGGRFADRWGPRKVLFVAAMWWAVFTALVAVIPAGLPGLLGVLLVTRFLLGVGEAMVFPASNRLVAGWIPTQERGLANGIIFAGVGAGAGITPPLITYILVNYGWRASFWICALIGIAAGFVWRFIARDRPEDHPWVQRGELEYIREGLPKQSSAIARALPWGTILRSRNVWALTASYFTFGYVAYIFFTWFFIYLNRVRGLDLKASALYSMLPFIAMAAFSTIGGWVSDKLTARFGKRIGRCGIAAVCMGGCAIVMALAMEVESARVASIVLAAGAGFLYLSSSSFWSTTADIGGRSAGSVSGVMNMGNQIGGTVTASLTPLLAEAFGWSASFFTAAALCGLGAITWLLVDPERAIEPAGDARELKHDHKETTSTWHASPDSKS